MAESGLLITLTKIVLIADIAAILTFVGDYSLLAKWWRNPIGRTLVLKDLFLLGVISLTVLSVFFHFSRLTSTAAGWLEVAMLGGMALAMLWRVVVFERIHRHKKSDEDPRYDDGGGARPDGRPEGDNTELPEDREAGDSDER
jgi:hypothetical protein